MTDETAPLPIGKGALQDAGIVLAPAGRYEVPAQPMVPFDANRLMEQAIAKGADVAAETLETLYRLAREEREDSRRVAFNQAFAAFRAECPLIQKTGKLPYTVKTRGGGTKDVTSVKVEEMVRVTQPILSRHGLSVRWGNSLIDGDVLTQEGTLAHRDGHEVTAKAQTTIKNANPGMTPQQQTVSAQTTAMKMVLRALLSLADTDDETNPADLEPVGDAEIAVIEGALGDPALRIEREAFFAWAQVGALHEMTRGRYREAVAYFDRKRAGAS